MKYIKLLILLLCLATAASAQQKPPYDRTTTNQVMADRATWSRYFLALPKGPTPGFPSYVPDSLKCGALFYKTTDTALYQYNCVTHVWGKLASLANSNAHADSVKYQILHGDNTYSGTNTHNGQEQFQNEADFQNPVYFNNTIHVSGVPTASSGTILVVDGGNEMKRTIPVSSLLPNDGGFVTLSNGGSGLELSYTYNPFNSSRILFKPTEILFKNNDDFATQKYGYGYQQIVNSTGDVVYNLQNTSGVIGIDGHLDHTGVVEFEQSPVSAKMPVRLQDMPGGGLGTIYSKTEVDAKVLTKADSAKLYGTVLPTYAKKDSSLKPNKNLYDIASKATALANLGGLAKTGNLSDVSNATTARQNLGVRLSYRFNAASTTYTFTVNTHAAQVKFSSAYLATSPILNKWVLFMGYYGHTQLSLPPNHLCDSLLARGYNVVTINVGNTWGNLAAQQLYQQLIKYCVENFNFEYQPYVIAESMGTLAALNMINNGTLQARSLVALTPVVNLYGYYTLAIGQASGTSIQTAYNFPQSLDSCKKAIYGYDPYQWVKNNFGDSVYNANNIPTYFLQGNLDSYVGWTRTMVKAAISAGRNQYLSEMNGFGHDTLGITAVRINAIANWMAAPTRLSRVIPGKQTAKIDSTFTPMQGITDPTQTATQLTYKNSAGLLASVPIYYDAVNRRYGFGSAATTYKYEFNTSDQSNRFAFNATSTLAFANNAFYWFLNTSPANYGMDMQFYKNTAGAGVGTSEFIMRSSALRGTGKPYTYFQMHMDSILTSSLNLSAPNKLILSVGWDNATGTSTGIPFLNAYGASGAAFTGAVFGSGANALNGSGIPFQWKAHIAPYTDAAYNNGDAAYRWLNIYAVNGNIKHLVGGSATPTIAAGAGAGTLPTVSITGTDAAGEITITTGTTPTAAATLVTVTFNTAYAAAPYLVLMRSSTTAPTDIEIGTRATGSFTLTGTLAASTTYKYNYVVVQ